MFPWFCEHVCILLIWQRWGHCAGRVPRNLGNRFFMRRKELSKWGTSERTTNPRTEQSKAMDTIPINSAFLLSVGAGWNSKAWRTKKKKEDIIKEVGGRRATHACSLAWMATSCPERSTWSRRKWNCPQRCFHRRMSSSLWSQDCRLLCCTACHPAMEGMDNAPLHEERSVV
jgi:hypothetical protein